MVVSRSENTTSGSPIIRLRFITSSLGFLAVEPELNLSLKLPAPSLKACADAMMYCMLAAKRERGFPAGHYLYVCNNIRPLAWLAVLDGQPNGSRTATYTEPVGSGKGLRPFNKCFSGTLGLN